MSKETFAGEPLDPYALKDVITRLRDDLAAALAECERLNKSRNRWGKKYNDCLGKLRLAVMSDSDECKELTAQNNNLRADLSAVTAERDRLLEALRPFAELMNELEKCKNAAKYGFSTDIEIEHLRRAKEVYEKKGSRK